ncbi:hypothetical protein HLV37_07155 [Eggerthellaceae bacterium zg-1084]|uniref:hypothetical protein n=1 Tax=Berryella wangjianweii TaxID=2734634 RepID=UPI0015522629|nr:hypothetical protein [Berryella wangjianweii]NPD31627.1 hypothetical protein [Berryella wangjianweii]
MGSTIHLKRGYGSVHGDRGFAQAVVAVDEAGVIVAACVEEFEATKAGKEGMTPVPNADLTLGKGFAEGFTLFSKLDNDAWYSGMMEQFASATQRWSVSQRAVARSLAGREVGKIEAEGQDQVDAIAGATLADAAQYRALILEVAAHGPVVSKGRFDPARPVSIGCANGIGHGNNAWANAVTVVQDGVIAAASVDEFMFVARDAEGYVPLSNLDGGLGASFAPGQMLVSKSLNSVPYSQLLRDRKNATLEWEQSMRAIEASLVGIAVDEPEEFEVDDISGSTLVDAVVYGELVFEAAQAAHPAR